IKCQAKLWRYFLAKVALPKVRAGCGFEARPKWLHHRRIRLLVKSDPIATSRRTSFLAEPAAEDGREFIGRTARSADNVHSDFCYDGLHRSAVHDYVQRTFRRAASVGWQEQDWIAARVPGN